jgi:phage terminase large subunit
MSASISTIDIPDPLVPVFSGKARFRGAYGGRGSGKTRTFALMTAIRGYQEGMSGREGIILCAREHLNSLDESSLEEIKAAISSVDWLADYYEVGERYIRSKDGRISYAFSGLRRNVDSLKSKSRILLCWVDESESVSETAWQKLIPTVREHDSEIWVTWNPESKESATHKRFRENPPEDSKIVEINWQDNPWFPDVLEQARLEDLEKRPHIYPHVWEGDFVIHVEGAFYAMEMLEAKSAERITAVPYDKSAAVVTAWDLGMADTTAIWFAQFIGKEVRIIDFYENSGLALDHYVQVLQGKGYTYDQHILPHDVRVKELGTGKSRLEVLQSLGLTNVDVAPMLGVEDGIQQVRSMIPRCWFDADKCERGIDALRQYRRDWDEAGKHWRGRPLHDWSSHAADAFRYLAIGYKPANSWGAPIRRGIKGVV